MMPTFLAELLEEWRRRWGRPVGGQVRRSLLGVLQLTSRQMSGRGWMLESGTQGSSLGWS